MVMPQYSNVNEQKTNEEKVPQLKEYIYPFIESFLKLKAKNSANTASDYENDIRTFFWFVKNKEIELLTVDDLKLTLNDVENYQLMLSSHSNKKLNNGNPYAPTSIARKISSVKKLYSKLEANDYPVKEAWFKVDKIKGESESYGVITWEQATEMMEIVKTEEKGDIKACLIETAVVTCFRQNSLLNLTWQDNVEKIDGVWVLSAEKKAIGKGKKKRQKPINDDLYEKLLEIKEKYKSDKLFPLQKRTVIKMMQKLREKMNLDNKITFHSLKKCGISEAFEITNGNIMAVAEQGDHESFGTTMKYYLNKKKKFSQMVGLQIGKDVDLSPIEALSHEELLNLIKNASKSLQRELLHELKK